MVLVISGIALFGFGFIGDMLAGTREELRSVGRSVEQLVGELKRERSERTK